VTEGQGEITYDPLGTDYLEPRITYYWRIDEMNGPNTTTGTVWSFTTYIAAPLPATPVNPVNGANDVVVDVTLSWLPGARATSHDVYFGTSVGSLEFKVNYPLEDVLWNPTPGAEDLLYDSTYWWRIDEVGLGGTTEGATWSFTTGPDVYPPIFTYLWVDFFSITAHEATIGWTTDELSDSLLEYGLDTSYGSSVYDGTLVKEHSFTLTGLQPGTEYYFRATSTDQAEPGNSASMVGPPFTTLANTPPVAADDSATTNEETAVVIDVLATASDFDGDALTVELVTQGTNGSVDDNGDGTVTYTPIGAAPYTDTFEYTINDGYGGTAEATVTITVNPGDVVTITRANYRARQKVFTVQATSSQGGVAVLTVVGYGPMTYNGENVYTFKETVATAPGETVTVKSDLGGSATASVTHK